MEQIDSIDRQTIGWLYDFFWTVRPLKHQSFQLAPESAIRNPGQKEALRLAIDSLLVCVNEGQSIFARHNPQAPIINHPVRDQDSLPSLFCQSSGTSGRAKTIKRSQSSWIRSFEVNKGLFSLSALDHYGVLGSLGHSLSLYAVMEALHIGADLHLLVGLAPNRQVRALAQNHISVLYATPSQLRLLLDGARMEESLLPDMRLILSGGGKLDSSCRESLGQLCPNAEILEFYGASETSFISIADASTPPGSVGHPYPGVEFKICDEAGIPTNGVGEIWVKSPYLFEGYWQAEGKGQLLTSGGDTKWHDGFLTVGEMGFLDGDGNLFLKGRKSRMITVADQNVFLEDVEAIVQLDADIRNCAALSRPDPQRGHHVVVAIEVEEGCLISQALFDRLKSGCRSVLGALATPKDFIPIASMPMLPSGKPDLVALAALLDDTGKKDL